MYFLDTNALYSYIGREKLNFQSGVSIDANALNCFLDCRDDKALASSAYIEAMIKFRNKPELAKYINDFIYEKNLRLFNNVQYYGYDTDSFRIVTNLDACNLQRHINKSILPNKIDIEVRFSVMFYEIMILLYLKYVMDTEYTVCQTHLKPIGEFIRDKTLAYVESSLKSVLEDAYENHEGKEEQTLKNAYIDLLEMGCKLVDITMKMVCTNFNEDTFQDNLKRIEDEINDKYNQMRLNRPQNYLMENMDSIFIKDMTFLNIAKPAVAKMFSEQGKAFHGKEKYAFKEFQLRYLEEEIFAAWMQSNQKMRKNDIFDFMFLGCADYRDTSPAENVLIDKSTYLLTFDDKIDRFIEKYKPMNGKIIRRFHQF